jgi:hypothetical protein
MVSVYILYAYHEDSSSKDNLKYFLENGYISNPEYHFLFIINGHHCDIEIPTASNISIYKRDNKGYDFGAWTYGLTYVHNPDKIIFLNSTIKGPFLSSKNDECWIDQFTNMITDTTKLAGISINCPHISNGSLHEFKTIIDTYKVYQNGYLPHVQSMLLVTDAIGLEIGIKGDIFNENDMMMDNFEANVGSDGRIVNKQKEEFVIRKEIGYSAKILESGYNINCILSKYKDKNYRDSENHDINNNNGYNGDPFYNHSYFEDTIDPYEAIFIKTNRGIEYNFNRQIVTESNDFHIRSAHYGYYDTLIDITDKLKTFNLDTIMKMNPIDMFGDPCFGVPKLLRIRTDDKIFVLYEHGGKFVKYDFI